MISKAIEKLYLILFFLTPLFLWPSSSEIFELNKSLLIEMIAIFVTSLKLLQIANVRKINLFISEVVLIWMILLVGIGASVLTSIDFVTSVYGAWGRFQGGYLSYICWFFLAIVLASSDFVKHQIFWKKIGYVSLISASLVVLWGLPAQLFGFDLSCLIFTKSVSNNCWGSAFQPAIRMFSTIGQPNWLGGYLVSVIFFVPYLWKKSKNKEKFILMILSLIIFWGIIATKSKTALFSLLISLICVFCLFFCFRFLKFSKRFLVMIFSIILIVGMILFSIYSATKATNQKMGSLRPTDSFLIRQIVWKGSLNGFLKLPITGSGLENFANLYPIFRFPEHNQTSEWDFVYNRAHNEYLQYLATTGLIGTLSYLLWLVWSVIFVFKNKYSDNQSFWLTGAIFSLWIGNLTGFSTTTTFLFLSLIPLVGLVQIEEKPHFEIKLGNIGSFLLKSFAIITCAYFWFQIINFWSADKAYQRAQITDNPSEASLELLDAQAKFYHPLFAEKTSEALMRSAYLLSSDTANNEDTKYSFQQLITLSNDIIQKLITSYPFNWSYKRTQIKNGLLELQIDPSINNIVKLTNLINESKYSYPTDPKLDYFQAIAYKTYALSLNSKSEKYLHFQKALDAINLSLMKKSDWTDALETNAEILQLLGNKVESKNIYEKLLKMSPENTEIREKFLSL